MSGTYIAVTAIAVVVQSIVCLIVGYKLAKRNRELSGARLVQEERDYRHKLEYQVEYARDILSSHHKISEELPPKEAYTFQDLYDALSAQLSVVDGTSGHSRKAYELLLRRLLTKPFQFLSTKKESTAPADGCTSTTCDEEK